MDRVGGANTWLTGEGMHASSVTSQGATFSNWVRLNQESPAYFMTYMNELSQLYAISDTDLYEDTGHENESS